jgi:hypothetical protein
MGSALALLMTRVLADDTHDALPADDAAGFTTAFYRSADLHDEGRKKRSPARRPGEGGEMLSSNEGPCNS